MPRHQDPDLEERILKAADALWRRGGEPALTMRAVARAARTNTPAVYRRFKSRQDLIRGLLLRIAARLGQHVQKGNTLEQMAEAFVDYAVSTPNEYKLFYTHASLLDTQRWQGAPRPIRESRPNFALTERLLSNNFGGRPEDHTQTALAVWGLLHGTSMLLVCKSIPEGHEQALREACRAGVRALLASVSAKKH